MNSKIARPVHTFGAAKRAFGPRFGAGDGRLERFAVQKIWWKNVLSEWTFHGPGRLLPGPF